MSDRKLWSLGFVFTSGLDAVILLKKSRSLHIGLWNGLGGSLENNESYVSSMVRECLEESGVVSEKADWARVGKLTGDLSEKEAWSVGVFAMWDRSNQFSRPSYLDMSPSAQISPDKAVYVPVNAIGSLNLAPFTSALVHLSLEKLKKPGTSPVAIQTTSY